jgi:hypothetical protein
MAQLRWQKPANGSDTLAMAQIRWQRTSLIQVLIELSDLDRPLCHPLAMMALGRVTPMHHLTIVVSSAASGPRR